MPSPRDRSMAAMPRLRMALALSAAAVFASHTMAPGAAGAATDGKVAAACAAASPPPPALAAGFTRLEFCSDFLSPDEIDEAAGQCPDKGPCDPAKTHAFMWYRAGKPFDWSATSPSDFEVKDGALTIWGGRAGLGLITAFKIDGGHRGYTPGPSFYAEARLRVNQFPPDDATCAAWKKSWPAFWTMDACHLYGSCREYLEIDIFEYLECEEKGRNRDAYGAALHDWVAIDQWGYPCGGPIMPCTSSRRDAQCKCHQKRTSNQWSPFHTGFFGERNLLGDNRRVASLGWLDWDRRFYTVGALVKSKDRIDLYAEDRRVKHNPLRGTRTYLDNDGDDERYPLILGSDGWPMSVDWVRVWVKP